MVCLALLVAPPVSAQLSPGPLAAPHAAIEGVKHCTQCHDLGKGITSAKCLHCHTLLAERVAAGKGLHAGDEHARCETCHSDHHGRDFALIHWPDGEARFDHTATGFALAGAHLRLRCRDCHRESMLEDPGRLRAAGKDPEHSHLGLRRDCQTCHADPHRGDASASCIRCHDQETWRPGSEFDHATTRYPLRGRHTGVTCVRCHLPGGSADRGDLHIPFTGLAFGDCGDCHQDPHAGRFAGTCARCHRESGWTQIRERRFDHDQTRYPLRGRHATVDCATCHRPDTPHRPLAHDRCTDCHLDAHRARFTVDGQVRACDDCHGLEGFSPSTFSIADHAGCAYPLTGAHRAVSCRDCHHPTDEHPAGLFRHDTSGCLGCHADPHGSSLAGLVVDRAPRCESCHRIESWRQVTYPHAGTGFALEGRHAETACTSCHPPAPGEAPAVLRFGGVARECAACHEDVHQAQFLLAGETRTRCERCHGTGDWPAIRFDHRRDSRFVVDGAHAPLACQACHPPLDAARADRPASLRYRPLPTDCVSCHPAITTPGHGGGS